MVYKKTLLIIAILAAACFPSNSFAHQKDDVPTITLDKFISRIQYDTKEQRWGLKGKDNFPHVAIEVRYNFGLLLRKSLDDHDSVLLTVLLDNPFRQSRPSSFQTANGKKVTVDDFKILFIPKNSRIPRENFPAGVKQFEKFLQNHEPMTFIAHATMWGTSKYLRKRGHFYYLDVHFEELELGLTPEKIPDNLRQTKR